MGLESTIGVAKTGTNSVRTTVPEGITEFLGVKAGDKLDWKMDVDNGERAAIVTKKSDKNNQVVELARYSMRQKRGRKVDGDI
jgi:bifunctional DNA-binding transcriptional regulator/antitoxin component of YhaV-PrlF toxin-antitoxin module